MQMIGGLKTIILSCDGQYVNVTIFGTTILLVVGERWKAKPRDTECTYDLSLAQVRPTFFEKQTLKPRQTPKA